MGDKQPAHVEQALSELAGAANEEQRRAARKRLTAAGINDQAPEAATAAEVEEARRTPPKGRTTKQEARGSTA